MNKLAENKQRKRLRLTMCFIYLFQIFLCTSPFVLLHSSNGAKLKDESVFSIIYKVLTSLGEIDNAGGFTQFLPYFFLVFIPVTGFFLCALDRERNIKNICAVIFNFFAIMAILMVVPSSAMQIGSVLMILLYVIMTFLATAGMLSRLNKEVDEPVKTKIPKEEREY